MFDYFKNKKKEQELETILYGDENIGLRKKMKKREWVTFTASLFFLYMSIRLNSIVILGLLYVIYAIYDSINNFLIKRKHGKEIYYRLELTQDIQRLKVLRGMSLGIMYAGIFLAILLYRDGGELEPLAMLFGAILLGLLTLYGHIRDERADLEKIPSFISFTIGLFIVYHPITIIIGGIVLAVLSKVLYPVLRFKKAKVKEDEDDIIRNYVIAIKDRKNGGFKQQTLEDYVKDKLYNVQKEMGLTPEQITRYSYIMWRGSEDEFEALRGLGYTDKTYLTYYKYVEKFHGAEKEDIEKELEKEYGRGNVKIVEQVWEGGEEPTQFGYYQVLKRIGQDETRKVDPKLAQDLLNIVQSLGSYNSTLMYKTSIGGTKYRDTYESVENYIKGLERSYDRTVALIGENNGNYKNLLEEYKRQLELTKWILKEIPREENVEQLEETNKEEKDDLEKKIQSLNEIVGL